jgi:hypothetical protein
LIRTRASMRCVTKDGNESQFFWAWERAVDFMHRQGMYSGGRRHGTGRRLCRLEK